ncbi:MAG TPA: alpha/beta hydrolase [Streptosporangiaceae bacterium]
MSIRVRKGHMLLASGAAVVAAVAAVSAGAAIPASAQPAAPGGSVSRLSAASAGTASAAVKSADWTTPRPTVVLVHGAWADSSSWDGVIERLRAAGYPVVAAADPLAGLDQDSASVASLLRSIKGPIVLAGHSYGGAVITNAAAGNPNVKALVYVAAFAPDTGESVGDLIARPVPDPIAALPLVSYPVVNANGTTDTAFTIDPAQYRQVFAGDVNPAVAADMAATQRPAASEAVTDDTTQAAWHTIPSWYLVAKQDHAIAPDLERFMAARANAHTIEANGSHSIMVSHPGTVAQLIETAAWSTR